MNRFSTSSCKRVKGIPTYESDSEDEVIPLTQGPRGLMRNVIEISSDDDMDDGISLGSADTVSTIDIDTKVPDIRGRRWCFTSFDTKHEPEFDDDWMSYLVFQLESAPGTGRLHWQGFIVCNQTVRLKRLINWHEGHYEKARGNNRQNRAYCTKEDSRAPGELPREYGRMPEGQGSRTDIAEFRDAIFEGKTDMELLLEWPTTMSRHPKFVGTCRQAKTQSMVRPEPIVYWVYGSSGLGKSHLIHNYFEGQPYICTPLNGFFSPYNGEDVFILDEFQLEGFPGGFKFLLRLLDRWPVSLNIKGSSLQVISRFFLISTIEHPDFFVPSGQDTNQLIRRIHNIIHFVDFKRVVVDKWSDSEGFESVADRLGLSVVV